VVFDENLLFYDLDKINHASSFAQSSTTLIDFEIKEPISTHLATMDTPAAPTEPSDPFAETPAFADPPVDTPTQEVSTTTQPSSPSPFVSATPTPSPITNSTKLPDDDVAAIDQLGRVYRAFRDEIGKVIIGQEEVIRPWPRPADGSPRLGKNVTCVIGGRNHGS